jgi:hypothetical protein
MERAFFAVAKVVDQTTSRVESVIGFNDTSLLLESVASTHAADWLQRN